MVSLKAVGQSAGVTGIGRALILRADLGLLAQPLNAIDAGDAGSARLLLANLGRPIMPRPRCAPALIAYGGFVFLVSCELRLDLQPRLEPTLNPSKFSCLTPDEDLPKDA